MTLQLVEETEALLLSSMREISSNGGYWEQAEESLEGTVGMLCVFQ